MRRFTMLASVLLLAGASASLDAQPVPQQDDQSTAAPENEAEPPAPEVQDPTEESIVVTGEREVEVEVCRRERPTGSRVAIKVCRTEKQLREEALATREVMTSLQSAGGPVVENAEEGSGIVGPVANPF